MLQNQFVPQVVVAICGDEDNSNCGVVDLLSFPTSRPHMTVTRHEQQAHPPNGSQQIDVIRAQREIREVGVTDPENQPGIRV